MRPGDTLPVKTYSVTRADLIRYAGASGDFNPIHWSDRQAVKVGLPGVIAHGMFTMALAGRALVEWAGDATALLDYSVRFTRPVVVPDDDEGARVVVGGVVRERLDDGSVRVDLTVTCAGQKVLGVARGLLRAPNTRLETGRDLAESSVEGAAEE